MQQLSAIEGYSQLYDSRLWVPEDFAKAVTNGDKRKVGRFFDQWYMYGHTAQTGGATPKPFNEPSFPFLRDVARRSLIDCIIISARIAQMKHVAKRCLVPGKQVGFRVVHERYDDPNWEVTEDVLRRCDEMERILATPTPGIHKTVKDFFVCATDEELVIDRKAMVISRDARGYPVGFHLVDGATVRPRLQVLLQWMWDHREANMERAIEQVSLETGVDMTNAAYVQIVDDRVVAAWAEEEISIDITNPSIRINEMLYGKSQLEKSLEATAAFFNAWNYNRELFKQNYPEAVLAVMGDTDPVGLQTFKQRVLGEVGPGQNWRLPVIDGGDKESWDIKMIKLRDTPKDMLFGELIRIIIVLKCAAYRMHPSVINFSQDTGSGESLFGHAVNSEQVIAMAQEEGFHGLLESMAEWLTRVLIKPRYDDLQLIWDGLDPETEEQRLDGLTKRKGFLTLDEIRAKDDAPPLGPDRGGDVVMDPTYMQWLQMKQQQDMMAQQQQAQAQYDNGDFGQENEDDMFGGSYVGDESQENDQGQGYNARGEVQNPEQIPQQVDTGGQAVPGQLQRSLQKSRPARYLQIVVG